MTRRRIIKFEKDDCAPCNMVSEYLDLKGVDYEKVNAFDQPEIAMKYKVRSVPTVIITDQDEVLHRIIGFKPDELLKALAV
jgi:glutaredoxin